MSEGDYGQDASRYKGTRASINISNDEVVKLFAQDVIYFTTLSASLNALPDKLDEVRSRIIPTFSASSPSGFPSDDPTPERIGNLCHRAEGVIGRRESHELALSLATLATELLNRIEPLLPSLSEQADPPPSRPA